MDADVIVVGAGVVGAACARALAQSGCSVLVLDSLRGGATAAGMGHLVVMDDNVAELALSHHSVRLWHRLAPQLPVECAFHRCGTLWVAADAAEMHAAEEKRQRLQAHGVDCELLNGRQLASAEPHLRAGLAGALRAPMDAIVYAPNVARWLLGNGGKSLRTEVCDVSGIDGTTVHLSGGERRSAQQVLLANGIGATGLCPDLPIRPKKGHLLITDRYPGRVHHQLVEMGYVSSAHSTDGSSVAFNLQPRPTGQLLLGSSRQFDSTHAEVEPQMLARMLQRALHYMPALGKLTAIRAWTGLRAATPDGLPILGPHPERPGLWLAVGHEGLGVTTALGSAELVAAQMTGRSTNLVASAYQLQRFAPVA
jgi:glycine/D-amino acid oxidase-like deaminating enzyme